MRSLDFKERYHDNNASLIHNILCMANTKIDKDCYIIFGISDDKKLVGLDTPIKHNENDLIQTIKRAKPNRSIYNSLNLEEILKQTRIKVLD